MYRPIKTPFARTRRRIKLCDRKKRLNISLDAPAPIGECRLCTKTRTRESNMPLYMYQAAYTPESWAAQLKNPQNRIETVGRQACEAVGGKLVGGWYCFGDYDVVFICDVPNNESMSAIALAVAAGGAAKASKTTVLMSGTEGVGAMKKADAVAKTYKPAR